ncbi:MAG: hypothetical protein MOIL_01468 [Candidatus Methanolliviera sp. GoM_oil]|nr:MAG: hypothetical protein MOIL_01468 [Candidatus Methanolliviera sp. GoM_oil]
MTSEIFIDMCRKGFEPLVGTYEKNAKGASQIVKGCPPIADGERGDN